MGKLLINLLQVVKRTNTPRITQHGVIISMVLSHDMNNRRVKKRYERVGLFFCQDSTFPGWVRPWVVVFVGFSPIITCLRTHQPNWVSRKHPNTIAVVTGSGVGLHQSTKNHMGKKKDDPTALTQRKQKLRGNFSLGLEVSPTRRRLPCQ